ncbi:BMP family ABC transporter substrate-binding protein [Terribacillus sp. DMT04]|uniref:BMP family ABC transporter substrate-binding protein n=1 Tax=Terribacillus sp. DMT04 TaxID=2850441 RepID=UPI001C2C829C|nr:BMP family ABC transporter substrate-binding protein [Terribacillus sp. DMT04]QXE00753.1 BMP family ABC transporter substrate-binding protein [Terribacillus sp. DMT04]
MFKRILLPICVLILCYLAGCAANPAAAKLDEEKRVGIVLTEAGLGDQELNDLAIDGLTKARDRLDIIYTYKEITADMSYEKALQELAGEKMNIIITLEAEAGDAVAEQAKANPDITYISFGTDLKADNLFGYQFDAEEAGYLAGVTAATITKSGKIGFIGESDSLYLAGFREGIENTNSDTRLLVQEASPDDQRAGSQLSKELLKEGADVLFADPGKAGKAVITQAALAHAYAIGAGGDQAYLEPEAVVTSAMLQVDHIIFELLKQDDKGEELPSDANVGLEEQGVGLSPIAVVSITDKVEGKVHAAAQELIEAERAK